MNLYIFIQGDDTSLDEVPNATPKSHIPRDRTRSNTSEHSRDSSRERDITPPGTPEPMGPPDVASLNSQHTEDESEEDEDATLQRPSKNHNNRQRYLQDFSSSIY